MKTLSRKTILLIACGVIGFVLLLLALRFGLEAYLNYRDTTVIEFVSEEDELRLRRVIGKPEGAIESRDFTYYDAIGNVLGRGLYADIDSVRRNGRVLVYTVSDSFDNAESPQEREQLLRSSHRSLELNLYFYHKLLELEPQLTADDVFRTVETMERLPEDDLLSDYVSWYSYWEGKTWCNELFSFYFNVTMEFEEYARTAPTDLTLEELDFFFEYLLTHEDYRDRMEYMVARNKDYRDRKTTQQSEE